MDPQLDVLEEVKFKAVHPKWKCVISPSKPLLRVSETVQVRRGQYRRCLAVSDTRLLFIYQGPFGEERVARCVAVESGRKKIRVSRSMADYPPGSH
eukprot:scaffold274203_cov21-Tisochrysis_lutea.AAC.1